MARWGGLRPAKGIVDERVVRSVKYVDERRERRARRMQCLTVEIDKTRAAVQAMYEMQELKRSGENDVGANKVYEEANFQDRRLLKCR